MKRGTDKLAEELAHASQDHNRLRRLSQSLAERLRYVRTLLQRLNAFPPAPCLVQDHTPEPLVHPLSQPVTLGADETCDIVLNGNDVTCQHACLESIDEDWSLRCLDAEATIDVNGTQATQVILASGDVISVAEHRLVFIGQEAASPWLS